MGKRFGAFDFKMTDKRKEAYAAPLISMHHVGPGHIYTHGAAELFGQFPVQGLLWGFSSFHFSTRKLPQARQSFPGGPSGYQKSVVAFQNGTDDIHVDFWNSGRICTRR